jgi:hypothetical protein
VGVFLEPVTNFGYRECSMCADGDAIPGHFPNDRGHVLSISDLCHVCWVPCYSLVGLHMCSVYI